MHIGIAYLRWRGKRSRHSRRMRTRNLTYLARGPWRNYKRNIDQVATVYDTLDGNNVSFYHSHLRCLSIRKSYFFFLFTQRWDPIYFNWLSTTCQHDDVLKWKHFPRCCSLLRGIHRLPVIPNLTSPTPPMPRPPRPMTRSFDVFFDLRLNKQLSKPPRRLRFETPSRS